MPSTTSRARLTSVGAVLNWTLLTRLLRLEVRRLFGALVRPALGAAIMAAVLVPLQATLWRGPSDITSMALVLLLLVGAGSGVYLATMLALWALRGRPTGSPEHAILATMFASLRRPKPTTGAASEH